MTATTTTPLVSQAISLVHEKLATLPRRHAHTLGVGRAAEQLTTDTTLIAASYLHDIGYGTPETGFHPLDGAKFLQSRQWPAPLVNLRAPGHAIARSHAGQAWRGSAGPSGWRPPSPRRPPSLF